MALTTYYVETGHGGSDSGTEANPWTSLKNAADAAITIGGSDTAVITCSGGSDTTKGIDFTQWTATGRLTIQLTEAHSGIFNTGNYYLNLTLVNGDSGVTLGANQWMVGLQYKINGTFTLGTTQGLVVADHSGSPTVVDKLLTDMAGAASGGGQLYVHRGIGICYFNNVISYDSAGTSSTNIIHFENKTTLNKMTCYNCTAVAGSHGFNMNSDGNMVLYNCIAQDNTRQGDYEGTHLDINYCVSKDTSATTVGASGANTFTTGSVTVTFASGATNFHITKGGTNTTNIIGQGFDLSGESVPVTDDIDGQSRGSLYDIGADQLSTLANITNYYMNMMRG